MKISRIKIHNWRSIKDVDICCEDLMIFIGQNNHGKSNVLSALLFFFGAQTCGELDFCKGFEEAFVEVTFKELDEHDRAQFAKYLTSDGTITVRKEIKKGGTFEFHGYCQVPNADWLKEESIGAYNTRDAISGTPLAALVPETGRITKEHVKQAQDSYVAANTGNIEYTYNLETSSFLGAKSVAQGIFGELYFVPAVKNASDEFNVKGKSVFNQLLTNVINAMSVSNAAYIAAKNQVAHLVQTLNKTVADGSQNENRPEQISALENLLGEELKSWNTSIDIEITPPDVDEALRVGTNVWIDDGIRTDVNRKGNGLQRSLIFALIKSWAKVIRQQSEAAAAQEESTRKASKSIYFIFEEPELYLHPQAQRELFASLKQLAKTNSQVFLSTHSSAFIDLGAHKSICIVYKNDIENGTKHLQCSSDLFENGEDKQRFNLTYWINPDRGELFFAKKVILVEGPTDKTVIPFLAKKLDVFRYDYTVIDCGSKDNIPVYSHLLNKFKLPYVVVYDRDHQAVKNPDAIASADVSSAAIEARLDTALGTAVIFENDIEEELGLPAGSTRSKPYVAIEHVSNEAFEISTTLKGKIEAIYS